MVVSAIVLFKLVRYNSLNIFICNASINNGDTPHPLMVISRVTYSIYFLSSTENCLLAFHFYPMLPLSL
jgi:hypothetical protein